MPRNALLLAILASSVIFLIGAPPALAVGHCAATSSPITWNGTYLQQTVTAYQCTDVDMIQFSYTANGYKEGMYDASVGPTYHWAASPPTLLDVKCGRQYTTFSYSSSCSHVIHVAPWCPPQTPRVVYAVGLARIHSKAVQSWGSWYWVYGVQQTVWC